MSLAYVFWHWPRPGVERLEYEQRLLAFQEVLGRPGTQTYRLARAPWESGPAAPVYEDWYPVADWADLGALNDEAVSGRNRAPHDLVAHEARDGAGGVYRRLRGEHVRAGEAAWLAKPAGMTYATFLAQMPEEATVWQRQMVLGPAPEFVVLTAGAVRLPWPATTTSPAAL